MQKIIVESSEAELATMMETAMPLHPHPESNVCLAALAKRIDNKQRSLLPEAEQHAIADLTVDSYQVKTGETKVLRCPIENCVAQCMLDIGLEKRAKFKVVDVQPVYRSTRECIQRK
jgi:hypothetical protein